MLASVGSDDGARGTTVPPPLTTCDLFCFVKVLETRKPYLTGVLLCAGLQTTLLLARRIDVTETFTSILIDGWLIFEFKDPAVAQQVCARGPWGCCEHNSNSVPCVAGLQLLLTAFSLRRSLSRVTSRCLRTCINHWSMDSSDPADEGMAAVSGMNSVDAMLASARGMFVKPAEDEGIGCGEDELVLSVSELLKLPPSVSAIALAGTTVSVTESAPAAALTRVEVIQ